MSRPIIAIIGRPNVGKSTLFNRLLKKRQAIVSPVSGTTRDRLYATVSIGDFDADIVDTAGLSGDLQGTDFGHEMIEQVQQAVSEADILLFVLDAQAGFTHEDQRLAEIIRKADTPTVVFINKYDNPDMVLDNKMEHLGLGTTIKGSLAQRKGGDVLIEALEQKIKELKPESQSSEPIEDVSGYKRVALVGRPNVGKSTLFNKLVGDDRVIVSDIPGTTRDSIDSKVQLSSGDVFILTDTAGLRRRGKVGRSPKVEQYSVMRTVKAMDDADLVLVLVDAEEGLTRGDVHATMHAQEHNKPFITVINKTDLIDPEKFNYRRFPFLTKHPIIFISAQDSRFLEELLELIVAELHKLDETPDQNS